MQKIENYSIIKDLFKFIDNNYNNFNFRNSIILCF